MINEKKSRMIRRTIFPCLCTAFYKQKTRALKTMISGSGSDSTFLPVSDHRINSKGIGKHD
jgi:hypothetical protein